MNIPVEVKRRLKQFKRSIEVEINRLKAKRVSVADNLKSRFVYNVCGYHITPIPYQLQSKLKNAHPSPLVPNISTKIMTSTIDNLMLRLDKLTACMKWLYIHSLIGLRSVSLCLRNNMNIAQSGLTSTNEISSNNERNLHSVNIDNQLYDNEVDNCTYNEMILMNMSRIN